MLAASAPGCHSPTSPSDQAYNPQLPTAWAAAVTNTYFPLAPGTTYQYRGQTSAGLETTTVEVQPGTRVIQGVAATVVRDRVYVNGALIEDTIDWYAQDAAGNVWYLGEDTKEYLNGQVVGTAGSFLWGVNGALPGIIMWSDPAAHVGMEYRQEYSKGVAEDYAKVVALGQSVTVVYGSSTGCITTEDRNSLEPTKPRQNKFYCPRIGQVLETLVGGGERVELISRMP